MIDKAKLALDDLEFKRMLPGEVDASGAIIEILAGAGGVDASDWAHMLMRIAAVKSLKPPFDLPTFAIKQHWHERFQHDAGNRWLRAEIAQLFLE